MPEASGPREIVHLGWRANGDGFDTALAVNRLRAAGARVWWLQRSHAATEAGDYLVALGPGQAAALARVGVSVGPWAGDVPGDALPLARPAVRLFAGTASKFPYFAYYALCLLRLGVDYLPCDGDALAAGALDDANVLILPGGFATWGIDAAENATGADQAVRDFLARGGTAIGSCGGAYYLSAGRPGWTGTAPAKPRYTHEYLQSGVGVVSIAIRPGPLGFGCPPTMDVPYYHGPIYDVLGEGIEVAATFQSLALPGRLAIDNPLDRDSFERDLEGTPAILTAAGPRGRAVLFSPHPEMGDLVRKYIALDGYVRRYLPIRGFGTMRNTLRHYHVADAPSFRLVENALGALLSDRREIARAGAQSTGDSSPGALAELCRGALERLPTLGEGEEGELWRDVVSGIAARLHAAERGIEPALARARTAEPALRHLCATAAERWNDAVYSSVAQQVMELDLGVALLECWLRAAAFDRALAP
jgi:putative intracellular protease/amidase